MKNDFSATIEIVNNHQAIVALSDSSGEWAGAFRVEIRSGRSFDLYEEGYRLASLSAQSKGGRLGRYSVAQ